MNYFIVTYKTGITYGQCKGMDDCTPDQVLEAIKEKYPNAVSYAVTDSERLMMANVESFWADRWTKN